MTAEQFQRAFALARSNIDLQKFDTSALNGWGLPDFEPVTVPLEAVAREIRWHAIMLNGTVDSEKLNECRKAFVYPSKRVQVVESQIRCPHCGEIL